MIPRPENIDSLARLGFTKKNCKEIILSLSVNNYCAGPKKDKDRTGEIWEFGMEAGEKEIYIKLKLDKVKGQAIAKCLSFHEAEYKMHYPYAE